MEQTVLHVIPETSAFMMSYVIHTAAGNAIVVDGGRPEDLPLLREQVKGRPILAWMLTHPHLDHITAFNEVIRTGDPDFDIRAVYCHFPTVAYFEQNEPDEQPTLREFHEILPKCKDKVHTVHRGDVIEVDEVRIEILYHFEESYDFRRKTVNDTSIVFRADTAAHSVLFLGDLGPEGGDVLLAQSGDKLRAEYCQMAHHGHAGVSADVYLAIDPKVCIWNARDWLWEEPAEHQGYRIYGVGMTRRWMDRLGARHIVTKDGPARITL